MRIFVLALLCSGCGLPVHDANAPLPVRVDSDAWVGRALADAALFWRAHDLTVAATDLSPALADRDEIHQKCVVAHEIGHAVGMFLDRHARTGLMADVLTTPWGDCLWSEEDQAELQYVKNR